MAQCEAKSKRSGEQCRRRAIKGRKVCQMHGGKSLAGPLHPNFKDGRHMYSAAMPAHLVQSVAAFHDHPETLQLLSEISTQRARAFELLQRIQQHGGGTWKEVSDAWDDLQAAANDKETSPNELRRATKHVEAIIKRGLAVDYNWRLLDNTTDRVAKLVTMQAQREEYRKTNLKETEAMMFVLRVGMAARSAIARHVTEDNLNNLSADELRDRIFADVSTSCRAAVSRDTLE